MIMSKLNDIVSGWSNYLWESKEVNEMAKERAVDCSDCEHAIKTKLLSFVDDDVKEIEGMACNLCMCPLSSKLRSPESKCDAGKW